MRDSDWFFMGFLASDRETQNAAGGIFGFLIFLFVLVLALNFVVENFAIILLIVTIISLPFVIRIIDKKNTPPVSDEYVQGETKQHTTKFVEVRDNDNA